MNKFSPIQVTSGAPVGQGRNSTRRTFLATSAAALGTSIGLEALSFASEPRPLPRIRVSSDQRGFCRQGSDESFVPRGFNYDHDADGRLLEDYWATEWTTVERHFAQMRDLGANVVRIHLQFGKFMESASKPRTEELDRLAKLIRLAESQQLYLDLTGLGCYHKADVPDWYDVLGESERWETQCRFWQAVATTARGSASVSCYDLMNEPVVPGGKRNAGDWLGPSFAGKHFVQFITLDQRDRPRPEIARAWTKRLVQAIREIDRETLITVGLVDWSLDRPGLTSGFDPRALVETLDFLAVHIYPERERLDAAIATLDGFQLGKPVLVEEIFPLKCSPAELSAWMDRAGPRAAGWISFYWGRTRDELSARKTIGDAILHDWLGRFPRAN